MPESWGFLSPRRMTDMRSSFRLDSFLDRIPSNDHIMLTSGKTNYLSHWLLTYHLLPLLLSTARSAGPGAVRIVNVTSDGHALFTNKKGIDFDNIDLESSSSMTRYGQSKLANILHAKELHKRYGPGADGEEGGEIWVAAVHPGHIDTYVAT